MNPRRKKRLTIVITLLIGFSAIAGLVLYALSQNIDLFYKPSEIHFGKVETGIKPEAGQRLRIGGIVVPGSVKRDPTSLKVSFDLVDMATPLVFNDTDPT
ncbi:cytochrome c maturation protein CcmE, partial [Psychrosphaera haliotis]|nr:cytochrome c maturation protein CcmE [Psychrosphaera haliotis]